ncbi:hypothetical protein U1Q18_038569 [Sarracenia purpurea var. burkii]
MVTVNSGATEEVSAKMHRAVSFFLIFLRFCVRQALLQRAGSEQDELRAVQRPELHREHNEGRQGCVQSHSTAALLLPQQRRLLLSGHETGYQRRRIPGPGACSGQKWWFYNYYSHPDYPNRRAWDYFGMGLPFETVLSDIITGRIKGSFLVVRISFTVAPYVCLVLLLRFGVVALVLILGAVTGSGVKSLVVAVMGSLLGCLSLVA